MKKEEKEIEDKIEYLQQLRYLDQLINDKISERDNLRSMATRIVKSIQFDRVQASRDMDPMGTNIAGYVDLEREIDECVDRYVDLKREINQRIESMDDLRDRRVLHLRFVAGLTLNQAAEEMGYTYRQLYRIYKSALNNFQVS